MGEGVALLFGKGVYCFNAGEFGSGELSESLFGLDGLFLDELDFFG